MAAGYAVTDLPQASQPSSPGPVSAQRQTAARAPDRAAVARRPRRRLWPLLLVVLAAGVGIWLLLRQRSATPAVSYGTDTATQGTVSILVNGPGTLSARASVPYPAPLNGTVSGLPAVGTVLRAGQAVGQIENDADAQAVQDARLAVQKAKAQLDSQRSSQAAIQAGRVSSVTAARLSVQDASTALQQAQTTLDGQTRLYAIGGISRSDLIAAQVAVQNAQNKLATAQASLGSALQQNTLGQSFDQDSLQTQELAVDQARATLQQAQATLDKQTLHAPVAGVVTSVDAVNGSNVSAGSSLLTVADTTAMELPVQIDETQISQIRPGMLARATLDALDGETVEGKVTSVSPSATVQNNISVFTVNVELPNPGGRLKAGMSAQTDVVVAEESGMTVSAKALAAVRTRSYVQLLPDSTVRAAQARSQSNQTGTQAGTQTSAQAGSTATGTSTALTVDAAGAATAVQTRVRVSLSDGTTTIVTSGLREGDTVLLPLTTARTRTATGTGTGTSTRSGTGLGGPAGFGGF